MSGENALGANPPVARGPSLRYAENALEANPAYSRGLSLRFRKCPCGKKGRGPEDDLKTYCKNVLGAKLQYPERLPRGRPEATLGEMRIPQKCQPPEISPSPLCATEGEAGQTDASASIAAILEKHKEGKSFREIDKALGLGNDTARKFITANEPPKNVSVTNFGTPEAPTSAVPMTSTEDRSDTREDARS